MPLIDSLYPSKNVFLPNSEELVTLVLVPQHQIFQLNKEVKKYLEEWDLLTDAIATKQVYEAAILIRAIRKQGTVDLMKGERGEQVFQSLDSFLGRFTEGQQEWLLVHYKLLEREALPAISDLTEADLERLFHDIDEGKDVSLSLNDFGYASLATFTHSLLSRLRQLREESQTTNSPIGFYFSEKKRKAGQAKARRGGETAETMEG